MKLLKLTILGLISLLSSIFAAAEQMQRFDNYEVHYSTVNSSFIPADVAKLHGIIRADNRIILNISIRKVVPGEELTEAQTATVTGSRNDLINSYPLTFKEVLEPGAVYYLADFLVLDQESSHFTVDVAIPEGRTYQLKFTQKMYSDE
jgi:hypothetical protein